MGKFCLYTMIDSWVMEIPIFHFSAFFHGGYLDDGHLDLVACDLLPATCFI